MNGREREREEVQRSLQTRSVKERLKGIYREAVDEEEDRRWERERDPSLEHRELCLVSRSDYLGADAVATLHKFLCEQNVDGSVALMVQEQAFHIS